MSINHWAKRVVQGLFGILGVEIKRKPINSARPFVHPTGTLEIDPDSTICIGLISIGRNSQLRIGKGSSIDASISIGEECIVSIGPFCKLNNLSLIVENRSNIDLNAGCILNYPPSHPGRIYLNNGRLTLEEKANVKANLMVRFGGAMRIGKYTGIGYGTSIRCEEQIEIGDYGLISYDVRIFDTNTHSTNWQERRERIEKGYPNGAYEEKKPSTHPILIGNDVWIGEGATVLKGTVIGNRCILGTRVIVSGATIEDDNIVVAQKPQIKKFRS